MLNKECLEYNVHEYLGFCKVIGIVRGVGVISDKQFVFYTDVNGERKTHDSIAIDIEKAIHPDSKRCGSDVFRKKNAYIFAVGSNSFSINLPDNNKFSMTQLKFILEVLDQIDLYNKEFNTNVKISFSHDGEFISDYLDSDVIRIKKELEKKVTKNVIIEEEKIIGKTLEKEEIIKNLKFHIGLEKCSSISEIFYSIKSCRMYLNDEYYKNFIYELLPDANKLFKLCDILIQVNIDDEKVENVNFSNVYNIIITQINKIFLRKNYTQLLRILAIIKNIDDDFIKQLFPNVSFFHKLLFELYPEIEERKFINEALLKASNKEDIFKIIATLSYNKLKKEAAEKEELLFLNSSVLEEFRKKQFITLNKEILNELIKKKKNIDKTLASLKSKLSDIDILLEKEKCNNHENKKKKYSNNKLLRFLNKKNIQYSTDVVNSSNFKISELELEKEKLTKEIKHLISQIKDIKDEFKKRSNLDFFPENESELDSYYIEDTTNNDVKLMNDISNLEEQIKIIKEKLEHLIQQTNNMFNCNIFVEDTNNKIVKQSH